MQKTQKTLDTKLAEIRQNPDENTFIIAYAADPDMGGGIAAGGEYYPPRTQGPRHRSIQEFYASLVAITEQAKIDIMLASVSTMDVLAHEKQLFVNSPVTPAIRANDTTDTWPASSGRYKKSLACPFATTTIEEARYGTLTPAPGQIAMVNLGLYAVTFNNDLEADHRTLSEFKAFRLEAGRKGFRYFLEVFNPNVADIGLSGDEVFRYVNDMIVRTMAGIPRPSRPEFLKVAYNGPAAMEALCHYDSTIVVGILGGPASTTYDAFKLIAEAKKYGARLTLFGRRIKDAEDPLAFLEILRQVADDNIGPEEAVKAYRGELEKRNITPKRSFEEDMLLHTPALK